MRVEAFNLHVVVGGAALTITNRASNDASATEDRRAHRRSFPLLFAGWLLIEALRATINGCLRVGDRKRRVVRRSTVEYGQTSAARDNRQRSKSRKMNLNKGVKRTSPETIEHM